MCHFIVDGMLLTTDNGNVRMATFSDEHMNKLFERFVLNYYKREYPSLKANADNTEVNMIRQHFKSNLSSWIISALMIK